MDQLIDKAQTTVEILLAVHGLALLIVNLTPTPKDDQALAKYYKAVEFLAGLVTKLAKR
jgi:hypothetical protein